MRKSPGSRKSPPVGAAASRWRGRVCSEAAPGKDRVSRARRERCTESRDALCSCGTDSSHGPRRAPALGVTTCATWGPCSLGDGPLRRWSTLGRPGNPCYTRTEAARPPGCIFKMIVIFGLRWNRLSATVRACDPLSDSRIAPLFSVNHQKGAPGVAPLRGEPGSCVCLADSGWGCCRV